MAALIAYSVDENGHRDISTVKHMVEKARSCDGVLFQDLKDRGIATLRLVSLDTHSGVGSAIQGPSPEILAA